MGKSAVLMLLLMTLLSLSTILPILAQTPTQNNIVVNADGTITPSTAPIKQEADTYTLTSNFQGSIEIQRSNIIWNGAGYSLQSLQNSVFGVELIGVTNVTIMDLTVKGSPFGCVYGIKLLDCTDCQVTNNTITNVWSILGLNGISYDGIYVSGGGSNVFNQNLLVNNSLGMHFESTVNNVVAANSITYVKHGVDSSTSGIYFYNSSGNKIYHNNFRSEFGAEANAYNSSNTWDNGYPDGGNYWIDYYSRYPNASMIDDSGIGNIAYVIDDLNRDNYPLIAPFNASAIVEASPTPSVNPIGAPPVFPVLIVMVVAVVAVLAVAGLVVYFKRRRH